MERKRLISMSTMERKRLISMSTMERGRLISRYISNFNEFGRKVQRNILKDLKIFNDSLLLSLVKRNSYVIILPLQKKFTDIKEFSHLKGKAFFVKGYGKHQFYKTFDDVRGWGGNPAVIGEEWALAKDKNIFNVVRHEVAHQIHGAVLSKKICKKIASAYKNASKKGYIRQNSSINQSEYFADGVAFFFNRSHSRKIEAGDMNCICNRRLLHKKDRILYDIIKDIF
ncbi:hypothetical protein HYU13_01840 [Candidatus Woesearchaeota archaeon]|nr:hypothetical protein [Candidatus Woesearchaeota archaeon]